MKIIVDNAIPYIHGRFPENVDVVYMSGKEITKEIVRDADVLIVRTRTKCGEDLLKDSKIRLVVTATIGTDHIDMDWCETNGIKVRNAPGCNAPGVAQYVFSSLFKSGFNQDKDILGIVGYGHVGSIVADWAQKMEIRTMISDAPREEAGYKDVNYQTLEAILKTCKAITLHVPLTTSGKYPTQGMVGEKEFELMQPGSILINSSRGGVVEENQLKNYIKEKGIKAVVDVWENEPAIDEELVNLALISTPHIAGYSSQGKMRATRMTLEALNEELGIETDLTGLECKPDKSIKINRDVITASYNPLTDSKNLLRDVSSFEKLRNEYNYRSEPLFR